VTSFGAPKVTTFSSISQNHGLGLKNARERKIFFCICSSFRSLFSFFVISSINKVNALKISLGRFGFSTGKQ
ncbi:MAG: hypothetical protein Q4F85_11935, partial [Prevotella sp.]|nr:hypothetical protein [Prevotella sp.]